VKGDSIEKEKIVEALDQIQLDFALDDKGVKVILLNEENCEEEIRQGHVAAVVSKIAEIKEVRDKLVHEQQRMGEKGGIVMDGRDIGTVVFPHADIKIFVTASIEVRTQRRLLELQTKGIETSKEEVQDNLIERDFIDSNRKESPLRQAVDAIVLDNSTLSRQQQLEWALDLVRSR
jgi:cytidylate kinase